MNRREFLKTAGVAGAAIICPPVFGHQRPQRFRIDKITLCYNPASLDHLSYTLDIWQKSLKVPLYYMGHGAKMIDNMLETLDTNNRENVQLLGWIDSCETRNGTISIFGELNNSGTEMLSSGEWHASYVLSMFKQTIPFVYLVRGLGRGPGTVTQIY